MLFSSRRLKEEQREFMFGRQDTTCDFILSFVAGHYRSIGEQLPENKFHIRQHPTIRSRS